MSMTEYQPKTCEWTTGKDKCRLPTIRGKSYCEVHYGRVYQVMTDDEVDQMADDELHAIRDTNEWETINPEE